VARLSARTGLGRVATIEHVTIQRMDHVGIAPANALGIRHVAFAVDDIDAVLARLRARGTELVGELGRYQDSYRLCHVRGPGGIIVELAEPIR
jgi:catechol 2,3-dioxygenase-like lactoylglutathione lyase family enzyme